MKRFLLTFGLVLFFTLVSCASSQSTDTTSTRPSGPVPVRVPNSTVAPK